VVNLASRAQPPLNFIAPALDTRVLALARWAMPFWIRWREHIRQIDVVNADGLVHLCQAFNAGETRFLLAFRHPSPLDSYCLAYLMWQAVPQRARELGIDLKHPVHAHFIYDRGIPLWAGDWVGWIYSRLGGTPIQRGKVDRQGLRSARQLLANGHFPLAAVERGLADREAEEAGLRMGHMRLVENFVAVTGQYVRQRPSAERFAETVMILRDTVCLVQGENPYPRPPLGPQRAQLTVGPPISVSDRWPDYKANRKQAVAQLTADLQTALEAMIAPAPGGL